MKTIRILSLGIMALALALASGTAEATLVLKVEDARLLPDGELQVIDNLAGDLNPLEGIITTLIDENGVSTVMP